MTKEEARETALARIQADYFGGEFEIYRIALSEAFDAGHAHATAEMAERVEELEGDLRRIRDFLQTQPVDVLGSDGDEGGSWPIRDEFIYHINKTLGIKAIEATEERV